MSDESKGRAAVESDEPAIQPSALALLHRLGGDELLGEIIQLFIANTPPLIDAAQAGAASGQGERVRRALHSLKSSAGQLGAVRMQRLCGEGEMLAEHGDRTALSSLMLELETEFTTVRTQLKAMRLHALALSGGSRPPESPRA